MSWYPTSQKADPPREFQHPSTHSEVSTYRHSYIQQSLPPEGRFAPSAFGSSHDALQSSLIPVLILRYVRKWHGDRIPALSHPVLWYQYHHPVWTSTYQSQQVLSYDNEAAPILPESYLLQTLHDLQRYQGWRAFGPWLLHPVHPQDSSSAQGWVRHHRQRRSHPVHKSFPLILR